ncbi:MAG: fumarylacetoacetate hydrolase family protein [Rubrimonas sp.]|uniref:fumarylacetoacetate hydrolase family protein n=1 Tax=Rubrimonas sp. TaxID=2036015 RepID=UPI002FDD7CB3
MKLLRWGETGREKPGALDAEGAIRDLSAVTADLAGDAVSCEALDALRGLDLSALPRVEGAPRIGPCLGWVPNFHAIGLNYGRHAEEVGAKRPPEPILFSKATTCLAGPNDDLILPPDSEKSDWEVELGVVIGRWCDHVAEADALAHVAGYCVVNDVSERAWQIERKGQWVKGKSAPGFGPVGPWLVTADEIADPQALALELRLNGETMQSSTTADMIFSVAEIVSYMSRFMALRPGDLIATGTPEGVGMARTPTRFLRAGDEMALSVAGLGEQRQRVRGASE